MQIDFTRLSSILFIVSGFGYLYFATAFRLSFVSLFVAFFDSCDAGAESAEKGDAGEEQSQAAKPLFGKRAD